MAISIGHASRFNWKMRRREETRRRRRAHATHMQTHERIGKRRCSPPTIVAHRKRCVFHHGHPVTLFIDRWLYLSLSIPAHDCDARCSEASSI